MLSSVTLTALKLKLFILDELDKIKRYKADSLVSGDYMSTNPVEITSASADIHNSFVLLPFINKKLSLKVKIYFVI